MANVLPDNTNSDPSHDFDLGEAGVPQFFTNLLRTESRFEDWEETIYQAAIWMKDQGASDTLIFSLLSRLGCAVGLSKSEARTHIMWGIETVYWRWEDAAKATAKHSDEQI